MSVVLSAMTKMVSAKHRSNEDSALVQVLKCDGSRQESEHDLQKSRSQCYNPLPCRPLGDGPMAEPQGGVPP